MTVVKLRFYTIHHPGKYAINDVLARLFPEEIMSDGESSDGEVDFKPLLDIDSLPQVSQTCVLN